MPESASLGNSSQAAGGVVADRVANGRDRRWRAGKFTYVSRFVISQVQSGPQELQRQLPLRGYVVARLGMNNSGAEAFHARLDAAAQFHYPGDFPVEHCPPDLLGRDADGPFVWITDVLIHPHDPAEQPYVGMTGFAMNIAYVAGPAALDSLSASSEGRHTVGVVLVNDEPDPDEDPAPTMPDTSADRQGPARIDRSAASAPSGLGGVVVRALHSESLAADLPIAATLLEEFTPAAGSDGRQYWWVRLDRPVHVDLAAQGLMPRQTSHLAFVVDQWDNTWQAGIVNLAVHVAVIDTRSEADADSDAPDVAQLIEIGTGVVDVVGLPPRDPGTIDDRALPQSIQDRNAELRAQLSIWVARLTAVAIQRPHTAPLEIPSSATGYGYTLDSDLLLYRSAGFDGRAGERTTGSCAELIYWIIDDLARELAVSWTRRTPVYLADDDEDTAALMVGRWRNTMAALSSEWGRRTAEGRSPN